jgi:hypothetical protein
MKKWFHISLVAILLYACSTHEEHGEAEEKIEFQSGNLLNPVFFTESNLFNISFPLWFDRSVIEANNIDSIYLESVVLNWVNDSTYTEEVDYALVYAFKPNGQLKKCAFTDYYELTKLFKVAFDYSRSLPDSIGYTLPRIEKTSNLLIGRNPTKMLRTVSDLQRFNRLELTRKDEQVIVFKNTTSLNQEQHVFILRPENQNILFVDKLETAPEDVFYYGTPNNYTKAFCLTDLVKEDLVSETEFFEGEIYPRSRKTQRNGLITNTLFVYDNAGKWLGQEDSLKLNGGQFIKVTKSEFFYAKNGLPTGMTIKMGSSKEDLRIARAFKFNYAFREKENE